MMSNGYLVGFTFWVLQHLWEWTGNRIREQAGLGNQNLASASALVFTCYGSLSCSIKEEIGVGLLQACYCSFIITINLNGADGMVFLC